LEIPSSRQYFHKAHWQNVTDTTIHRTASVEDDFLSTVVDSTNSGMDVKYVKDQSLG
jgi:hypothetical protein